MALLAAGLGGCGSSGPTPSATVRPYLSAWSRADYRSMAALVADPPATFAPTYAAAAADLGIVHAAYQAGPIVSHGSSVTAPVTAALTTTPFGPVTLHATVALVRRGGHWLVAWSPHAIADQLSAGDRFRVTQTWPARAPVLGANGASLTPAGVVVGLVGSRITDAASLTSALTAALATAGVSAPAVSQAVTAAQAHPTFFEPVATISQAVYSQLKPIIYPLPGTSFETQGVASTITSDLAAHVVGRVGPITGEQLKALGAPYTATSTVGQGGLEATDERQLAGTPAAAVTIVDGKGATVATLASTPAKTGAPVRTGIDPAVQTAAESALDGEALPAALVAVRASTGQILASVSRPTATAFDLALDGSVPPGSTFKVITATALLEAGDTTATPTVCPSTITVGGRTFKNFESERLTNLDLLQAFAASCNTAFISLATSTVHDGNVLTQVGSAYGLGATVRMGLPASGGRVPAPATPVDLAASAIGQGQTTVSPLAMATVAATADSGFLHLPRLVAGAPDDSIPTPGAAGGGAGVPPGHDGGGRHLRHRVRRRAARRHLWQDGHRRVWPRPEPAHPRLVHRISR